MIDNIAIPNSQNHSSVKPRKDMYDIIANPNSQNYSLVSFKPQTDMIDNIAIPSNQNHPSIKPQTVMVDNKGIPNSQNHSFSQTVFMILSKLIFYIVTHIMSYRTLCKWYTNHF